MRINAANAVIPFVSVSGRLGTKKWCFYLFQNALTFSGCATLTHALPGPVSFCLSGFSVHPVDSLPPGSCLTGLIFLPPPIWIWYSVVKNAVFLTCLAVAFISVVTGTAAFEKCWVCSWIRIAFPWLACYPSSSVNIEQKNVWGPGSLKISEQSWYFKLKELPILDDSSRLMPAD